MKICVIGSGYVGLTTSAILADLGHNVFSVDIDKKKIDSLNKGEIPIYEPGLDDYISKNVKEGRLSFSTEVEGCIMKSDIVMITVGTPPLPDGSANMSFIKGVVDTIGDSLFSHKIIVTKSTVPPGTNEWIHEALVKKGINEALFDVVSNPEFLKEGSAVNDLLFPDKIVIGTKSKTAAETIKKMYRGLPGERIVTSLTGAELIKYASNAFLATKISFINEIARVCEAYDVNVEDVALGIGTDPRIGSQFLRAGLGYGGSCFPKDVSSLHHAAKAKQVDVPLLEATMNVNETQVDVYLNKLINAVGTETDRKLTVWGLTFKPNTDDTRLSPALAIVERLMKMGFEVHGYDPLIKKVDLEFPLHSDIYESITGAHGVIVATEWDEFKSVDWDKVRKLMKGDVVLDGRNMLNPESLTNLGFQYVGLGRMLK